MQRWREAASLIIAVRQGQKYDRQLAAYNYNLLYLKRHAKSNFMPGIYVWPGGVIDPADTDVRWRELFANFGLNDDNLASLIPRVATRSQIFQPRPNELPRDISLRISAIRETFEESGILLCKRARDGNDANVSHWAEHLPIPREELRTWQTKVHDDTTLFLELCETLRCYPDLWALYEWSNWLTPTAVNISRYDAIFYMACMQHEPTVEIDNKEIESLKWLTPEKLNTIRVLQPQLYTALQLAEFKDMDKLLNQAMELNKEGSQLCLPVCTQLKDGLVFVLPGDTMYPMEVNLLGKQIIDKSDIAIDEYRQMTPIKNRFEFRSTGIEVISDNLFAKGFTHRFFTKETEKGQLNIKINL